MKIRAFIILCFLWLLYFVPSQGQSMRSTDSIRNLIDNSNNDADKISHLIELCSLVKRYNPQQAVTIAKEAVKISEKNLKGCYREQTYSNLAYMYCEIHTLDSATQIYDMALKLNDTVQCKNYLAKLYNVKGTVLQEKGNYIQSIAFHEKARDICQSIADTAMLITSLRMLGIPLTRLGNYDEALRYFLKAMPLAERMKMTDELAYINNNVAMVYLEQEENDKALPYLLEAGKLLDTLQYKAKLITININLANLYLRLDSSDVAIKFNTIAEILACEVHDSLRLGIVYANLSSIYQNQGNYNKAIQYNQKACDIGKRKNLNLIVQNALYKLGINYHNLNKNNKAIAYLNESLELGQKMGYYRGIGGVAQQLTSIYEEEGRYKDATEAYKILLLARDSMFSESKVEEITRMEMQYDFDKIQHQQELTNLKKTQAFESELRQQKMYRNAAITGIIVVLLFSAILFYILKLRQQQKLQKLQGDLFQYMQKSMSQQMNPHFIFNTLTSILYFIDHNEKEKGMQYVEKFAQLMRTALNNSQQATVAIADEIEFLQLFADLESLRFRKPFELSIHIDDTIDQKRLQVPAFLLQPIVENSIKHGLIPIEEKGNIFISIHQNNSTLICVVEDNGVGMAGPKQPASTGIPYKKHKSMATSLLQRRLQLLGIYYNREFSLRYSKAQTLNGKYGGTRVELELPVIQGL